MEVVKRILEDENYHILLSVKKREINAQGAM